MQQKPPQTHKRVPKAGTHRLASSLQTNRELIGLVNTSAFPVTHLVKLPTSRLLAHCRSDISTGRAVLDPGDFFPTTLLCTRNCWEANTGHLFGQEVVLSRHCNTFGSRFESPEVPEAYEITSKLKGVSRGENLRPVPKPAGRPSRLISNQFTMRTVIK